MAKGVDQIAETITTCQGVAEGAGATIGADALARLEAVTAQLRGVQTKFFLRMAPAVRYTSACLDASRALQAATAEKGSTEAFVSALDTLVAAVTTLDDRANAAGNMTIT